MSNNRSGGGSSRPNNRRTSSNGGGPNRGGGGGSRGGGGGDRRSTHVYKPIAAELMVHEAVPIKSVEYISKTKYDDWNLSPKLKIAIRNAGWTSPTQIQEEAFSSIVELRDVMGIATTGTGKTGAFLIPIIDALLKDEPFQTLCLAPTRELALQIEEEFKILSKGTTFTSVCLIGGRNINTDIQRLKRDYDLVVATPGRLKDLHQQKKIDLKQASVLILDEFDRMLDMGFQKDVMFLADQMGDRDQTLLFSATLDKTQKKLIDHFLTDPVVVAVSSGEASAEHINQTVRYVSGDERFDALVDMFEEDPKMKRVLVFAETKHRVKKVTKKLIQAGIKADEIHGNKSQNYRQKALGAFKSGKIKVLCATDVAARGLDIDDITHVINFEAPTDYDVYIHRVGRTGRAGKTGEAITFVDK
jgi:ATP-dependent RNA helicase RhlE